MKRNWKELIKNSNEEELKTFLYEFGKTNKDFKNQIRVVFAKPKISDFMGTISYYQNQISDILENHSNQGFIDYRSVNQAMKGLNFFIDKMNYHHSQGNLIETFCIAAALAMEGISAIPNTDDSSGMFGGAISVAFSEIEKILDKTNSKGLKLEIYNWLYEQVQIEDYNDHGAGDDLEPLFFKASIELGKLKNAYQFIDDQIVNLVNSNDWTKEYYTEHYMIEKINLLIYEEKKSEVEGIIDKYLHFTKMRQMKVDDVLSKRDFQKAEGLILEGIEIARKSRYWGTIKGWQDQLLELYGKQKNLEKYQDLARNLFLTNSSEIKYYKNLKSSVNKENWNKTRNEILTIIKDKYHDDRSSTGLDDLAKIFIEEKKIDELFQLVDSSRYIKTVIEYTPILKEKYSLQLVEIYKTAIWDVAEQTGRPVYHSLLDYLKKLSKLEGGRDSARELKVKLLEKYNNRPAMKEIFKGF